VLSWVSKEGKLDEAIANLRQVIAPSDSLVKQRLEDALAARAARK